MLRTTIHNCGSDGNMQTITFKIHWMVFIPVQPFSRRKFELELLKLTAQAQSLQQVVEQRRSRSLPELNSGSLCNSQNTLCDLRKCQKRKKERNPLLWIWSEVSHLSPLLPLQTCCCFRCTGVYSSLRLFASRLVSLLSHLADVCVSPCGTPSDGALFPGKEKSQLAVSWGKF